MDRIKAADQIFTLIKEGDVAMYFGFQQDLSQGNEKDKNLKKDMGAFTDSDIIHLSCI